MKFLKLTGAVSGATLYIAADQVAAVFGRGIFRAEDIESLRSIDYTEVVTKTNTSMLVSESAEQIIQSII
jgi:hypothetical protein